MSANKRTLESHRFQPPQNGNCPFPTILFEPLNGLNRARMQKIGVSLNFRAPLVRRFDQRGAATNLPHNQALN
jgi:hypothetical protein